MKKILLGLALSLSFNVGHASDLNPLGAVPFLVLETVLEMSGMAIGDAVASKIINMNFASGYDLKEQQNRYGFEVLLGIQEGKALCYGLCNPAEAKNYSYQEFQKTKLYDDLYRDVKDDGKVKSLFDGYRQRNAIIKTSNSAIGMARTAFSAWNRNMGFNFTVTANSKTAETLERILSSEIEFVREQSRKSAKSREAVKTLNEIISGLSSKK